MRRGIWLLAILAGTVAAPAARADQKRIQPKSQSSNVKAERRWAFLVGINDYANYGKLRYCRQDCVALRDALVRSGRFASSRVVTLTDDAKVDRDRPTYGQVYTRLPQVLQIAERDDLVLVFLSGHGVQYEGKGYFVPLDGGGRQTCIPLSWVTEQLEACPARHKLLILDACRNDVVAGQRAARSLAGSIVTDTIGKTFVTLYSCDAGQRASEHDKAGNGVYTHYLLEGLTGRADRDSDGGIDLFELHRYARAKTQEWGLQHAAPQSPVMKGQIADPIVLAYVKPGEAPIPLSAAEPSTSPPPIVGSPDTLTLDLGGGVTMELVLIPAGEFMMGGDKYDMEKPVHRVRISEPFYLGKYEVTQAQWQAVMGSNPSHFKGSGDLPVESVSWEDCREFCRKLSAKTGRTIYLPTEAQWEYACRAGTTTAFAYGDSLSSNEANFDGNYPYGGAPKGVYRKKTVTVGSYAPNAWGLYDMHGNVYEWCADWYDEGYYSRSPATDPTGAPSGSGRVLRGGSWYHFANCCRSAYRYWSTPDSRYDNVGFRVSSGAH